MKRYTSLSILMLSILTPVFGQLTPPGGASIQEEVVVNGFRTSYQNKSYLVVEQLTLRDNFSVNAAEDGEFYIKLIGSVDNNIPPTGNKNFIRKEAIWNEGVKDESMIAGLEIGEKEMLYKYVDVLGREEQISNVGASPSGKDLISFNIYDLYGQQENQYLPFTNGTTRGAFLTSPVDKSGQFYLNTYGVDVDSKAYIHNTFDSSPLARTIAQQGPGDNWFQAEKKKSSVRVINKDSEVLYWKIENNLPTHTSYYPANSLIGSRNTDEEGNVVVEYRDFRDLPILKRVRVNENGAAELWADTYYIYNDLGNLEFVLPPVLSNMSGIPAVHDLKNYAFRYKYDNKQRLIMKKIPGSDSVYMVYDNRDRLVLTQDGNQRLSNSWIFTKYDQLNRPIATGMYTRASVTTQAQMQAIINDFYAADTNPWYEQAGTSVHGYTDSSFPKGVPENNYFTITYYDNYGFKGLPGFGADYDYDPTQLSKETCAQGIYSFPSSPFDKVKGQVTGSMVKVLDDNNTWLSSVVYYDDNYRIIQTVTENYSGNQDKYSTLYNFPGWVLATRTSHQKGADSYGIKKRYTYDHAGRLVQGYHELFKNGTSQGEVLLAENKYNELGELIEKNLHVENHVPHQSIDYRYNIRGWLESVNNSTLQIEPERNVDDATPDLFGMELFYNNSLNGVPAGN